MLPKSVETSRGRYLQDTLQAAAESAWADWPPLTRDDYFLIGYIVVMFSYMDLNLKRIADVTDNAGVLNAPWAGKTAKLTMAQIEEAVQSLDWSEDNQVGLQQIVELRGIRNMLAHFVLRRFPNDNALACLAISAKDYERQLGRKPESGEILTAVLDIEQLKGAVKLIENVQLWLAKVTSEIELLYPRRAPDA
jgi:hypothetical protein